MTFKQFKVQPRFTNQMHFRVLILLSTEVVNPFLQLLALGYGEFFLNSLPFMDRYGVALF